MIAAARTLNDALPVLSGGVVLSCALKVADPAEDDGTVNVPISQPVAEPLFVVLNVVAVMRVADALVTEAPP